MAAGRLICIYQPRRVGRVYKMSVGDDFYIGSTFETLADRKRQHEYVARKLTSQRVYARCNEVGWGQVTMVLLEELPCGTKQILRAAEQRWMDDLHPNLNTYDAVPNKTKRRARKAVYMEEYRAARKETAAVYMKAYRAANSQSIAAYKSAYHAANKERIEARQTERIQCTMCSSLITRRNMAAHVKHKHSTTSSR